MKSNYKIAVIVSSFNAEITSGLIKGALKLFSEEKISDENVTFYNVPGAFEIPAVLEKICRKNGEYKYDGIMTVGCVIKGETAHFEYISSAVSGNINRIASEYSVPVGFCVLTCYTDEQAEARSRTDVCNAETNKGYEAASALIEMIGLMKKI
ncbi:MAG: 6,7-dimethyl-8-ribityllumazine synthase [Ignavibacteria bacterium]|nr:6,7-dimethyl-8-ribityllumazine synthase [Ignavibacteria bacterium]